MIRHKEGSITLSPKEVKELRTAYNDLYEIIDSMPTSIGDYFGGNSTASMRRVNKWLCWLKGEKFRRADYE